MDPELDLIPSHQNGLLERVYGIDASSANKEQRTGVEWYAYHLIQALKKQPLEEDERVVLYSDKELQTDLAGSPVTWQNKVLHWPLKRGWMQGRMSLEMLMHAPQVLFVPSQALPRVLKNDAANKKFTVTTIHDTAFDTYPEFYGSEVRKFRAITKLAVKKATHIIVPSEQTKRALMEKYHVSETRLTVTPLAADLDRYKQLPERELEPVLRKYRLSNKNYFLHIGRMDDKKNITTIIRAFEIFKKRRGFGDPFELILIGPPGRGFEVMKKYYQASEAKDRIKYLGWINEDEIPAILNGAFAYLFPSWYEGFGIPNLEAMACGIPLITSDIPVHHEVAADAALFVPPAEVDSWARSMGELVANGRVRDELIQKGLERAKMFSWDRTAKETLEVFRGLF